MLLRTLLWTSLNRTASCLSLSAKRFNLISTNPILLQPDKIGDEQIPFASIKATYWPMRVKENWHLLNLDAPRLMHSGPKPTRRTKLAKLAKSPKVNEFLRASKKVNHLELFISDQSFSPKNFPTFLQFGALRSHDAARLEFATFLGEIRFTFPINLAA